MGLKIDLLYVEGIAGLFAAKGEYLDHQEGDRYAEDGCQKVADDWRKGEHIVKYDDNQVLDEVVGDVGDKELDVPVQAE